MAKIINIFSLSPKTKKRLKSNFIWPLQSGLSPKTENNFVSLYIIFKKL